jgi:hypothetical protein
LPYSIGSVTESCVLQGRRIEPAQFDQVRQLVATHPEWSRYRLSRELCALWDWRTSTGQFKDMAARTLLAKLAQRGWIRLPERRALSPNRHRLVAPPPRSWTTAPIVGSLSELGGVDLAEVSSCSTGRAEVRAVLAQFHYLGWRMPVGENLQYLARGANGRLVAVLVFGAAAWKCAARDQWIGWTVGQRETRLGWIANNQRFLIAPWVRVRYLASHLLGEVARRIAADWRQKYGHPIVMLETFVERDRFAGTCYRAANWQRLGSTRGRSRQDSDRDLRVPVKEIYAYPLRPDWRKELTR